jgi:hypothetical protein
MRLLKAARAHSRRDVGAASAFWKAHTVAAGFMTTATLHSVCLSASRDVTASSNTPLARYMRYLS